MRQRIVRSIGLVPVLLALVSATALAQGGGRRDRESRRSGEFRSRLDTTVALERGGTVELGLVSGEIIVIGGASNTVRIRATSEEGRLRFDASPSRVALSVEAVNGELGDARYEVSVPAGTRLVANAVSGDITVRDTRGSVETQSVSGDVSVSNATDRVTASSVSGSVDVRSVTGSVRGQSVSGDFTLTDATGDVEAGTVSGDITITRTRSRLVRATTTSGDIAYDGNADPDGRYELRSHSGDVHVSLPPSADATFTVETFSGGIDTNFPITLQPGRVGMRPRHVTFKVGSGAARVSLESFSGDIIIRRGTGSR